MPFAVPRDNPFEFVQVRGRITKNDAVPTRVWWSMRKTFNDPTPHVYQLQAGVGQVTGTTWTNVGAATTNVWFLEDAERRLRGKQLDIAYRVVLTTPLGTYTSPSALTDGILPRADLIRAREIIRKEKLRGKVFTRVNGRYFKRHRSGTLCTRCLDCLTSQPTDPHCSVCHGTGLIEGYYSGYSWFCYDLGNSSDREATDESRGTVRDQVINARFLEFPIPMFADIWMNDGSDERYRVHTVKEIATIRGVALMWDVELKLVPFTETAYDLPAPIPADSFRCGDRYGGLI